MNNILIKKEIALSFLIMLYIFGSCTQVSEKKIEEENIMNIGLASESTIKLSSIIDSLVYIPLETKKDVLIGGIKKLVAYGNNFYILDELTSSVFCFDQSGHFIRKIGDRGVGPNEYIVIDDIAVHDQKIYLWDGKLHKLFTYNINSGNFEKEYRIDFDSEYIHVINHSWIALYGDYKSNKKYVKKGMIPNLLFWNIENNESHAAVFFDSKLCLSGIYGTYSVFTDMGSFLSPLENTIYQLDDAAKLDKQMILSFKEPYKKSFNTYLDLLKNEKIDAYQVGDLITKFPAWISINETNDYLILTYIVEGYSCVAFYHKGSGEYVAYAKKGHSPVINDMDNIANFTIFTSHENWLYSFIQPYNIKNGEMKSWLKEVAEDDNPIIVAMHMKRTIN